MIRSFRCADTQVLFETGRSRRFSAILSVAARKLVQLDAALELRDLASPPGNRLEALRGERAGQHSVRINDQFRVCFVWTAQGPEQVEIVDDHR
jgi:toxin HigB-1